MDFVQVLNILGLICSNRYKEKIRLLYILHTTPLLSKAEIDFMRKPHANKNKGDAEEAIEAEDFFYEDSSLLIEALPLSLGPNLSTNKYDIAINTDSIDTTNIYSIYTNRNILNKI